MIFEVRTAPPALVSPLKRAAVPLGGLFAIACIATGAAVSAEEESRPGKPSAYSTEELVAALSDRLTSIDSLLCEYTSRSSHPGDVIHARFARSSDKWHYAELSSDESAGTSGEIVYSNDGELAYAYATTKLKDGRTTWTSVQLQDPRPQLSLDPDHLLGLKLSNVGRSIVDVVNTDGVTKDGVTSSDGKPGALLAAHSVSADRTGQNVPKYNVSVVLDPAHDWLPRDILITQAVPPLPPEEWQQHWVIHEYRQVRDERGDADRWFPVSGTLHQKADSLTIELLVTAVRINPDLSETLFRPQIPDGVVLADTTSSGRGRLAFKGREFMENAKMDELSGKARDALGATSWKTWTIVLAINGVLVIALLVFLALRRHSKLS